MKTILHVIEEWLKEPFEINDRRWFVGSQVEVYLRKHRMRGLKTIDLANITVRDKGEHYYTLFLGALTGMGMKLGYERLIVQNVLEERFQKFHEKIAFAEVGDSRGPPSYIIDLTMKAKGE